MVPGEEHKRHLTLCIFAAVFSIVVCVIAGAISYRAHIASQGAGETYMRKLDSLQHDIDQLKNRFSAIAQDGSPSGGRRPAQAKTQTIQLPEETVKGTDSASAGLYRDELMRLRQIIDASGLEQFTQEGGVDLSFLKEMSDRQVKEQVRASYLKGIMTRNRQLLSADERQYGEEMQSLYKRARSRREDGLNDEGAEDAFDEMLGKYPDAYATAILIAERALDSVFEDDTTRVEEYRDMLLTSGSRSFPDVVTSYDIEAMPAIEFYLASRYIQQGRTAEAESLMDSLEQDYADSLVLVVRGEYRGLEPALELIAQLQAWIENGAIGNAGAESAGDDDAYLLYP